MSEQLAETIGVEGYIYLYPLVLMDTTRRQITNVEKVSFSPLRTPADVFINIPAFPPADFRAVVRPNFDTLYSSAFLDLSEGPRIVSVPAAGDNYYLLPFYDGGMDAALTRLRASERLSEHVATLARHPRSARCPPLRDAPADERSTDASARPLPLHLRPTAGRRDRAQRRRPAGGYQAATGGPWAKASATGA